MALIDVDSTYEQAELDIAVLPEGDYEAQVAGWEFETSKSDTPMINWTLEVINHPTYNGRVLWSRTPTQGRGKAFLTRFCQACRMPWQGRQIDPDAYIGCQVRLHVSVGEYQGRPSNNIDAISSI